ncbi:hypothetical protein [Arthrobacter sp. KBS0703]|uniref:hypothetical protein n=1 Tax=Arthrobacter sp. KBS0703 TaxID=1955698 RepID=UPI0021B117AE|nr:hypothetical protein [Arthrobacter sp. KBS0703]
MAGARPAQPGGSPRRHPVQAAAAEAGYGAVDQLAMVNVAVQLELLQRHAGLAKALLADQVHVTGLFYDIATARVLQITPSGISHLDPLPRNADAGTGAEPDTKGGAPRVGAVSYTHLDVYKRQVARRTARGILAGAAGCVLREISG